MLLLLLLMPAFPPISVLSRVRRLLRLLNVSVEELTELALWVVAPVWKTHAVSSALVCIGGEAFTIAHLWRTLAHVHLAKVKILVGIHATVAISKEVVRLQFLAFRNYFLLAIETVLRSLRMLVWPTSTRSQSSHSPAVGKLPNLILGHVDASSRCQVVSPHVIVITAQSTKLILIADGRFDLQEVVAIPDKFNAKMRLDYHFVIATFMNFNYFIDNMRQLDSRSIDFHTQLLAEVDFDICHLECDSFRPTGMFRLACIIRHTNWECVIDAISRKLIFAGTLEAKELSVECFVMRIAEDSADAWKYWNVVSIKF